MNNLELITKSWFWLDQNKNNEIALGQFADLLIANKPSLAKYKRKIILFLQKIDYIDPLFNGEIWGGDIKVDGVSCCWLWNGTTNYGYGAFVAKNRSSNNGNLKMARSHRFMLFLIDYDFDLDSELKALHRCDNPRCCNPNHIIAGSHQQNMEDMVNRDRSSKVYGELHHLSKLTDIQMLDIYNDLGTQEEIAIKYGVTQTYISSIKTGKKKLSDGSSLLKKSQRFHFDKLNWTDIDKIHELYNQGYSFDRLHIIYKIDASIVKKIIKGELWDRQTKIIRPKKIINQNKVIPDRQKEYYKLYKSGLTHSQIAKKFDVARTTITSNLNKYLKSLDEDEK